MDKVKSINLTVKEIKERLIGIIDDTDTADTELLRAIKALHKHDPKYTLSKLNKMVRENKKTVAVLCELLKLTPKKHVKTAEVLDIEVN